MTKCPACGNWSLGFDEYFGRYRCFRVACGWMPSSMAERCIAIARSGRRPRLIGSVLIAEGLYFNCAYDRANDVLILSDPTCNGPFVEVPDPHGTLSWRISQTELNVAGCDIVGVRRFGVPKALIHRIPAQIVAVRDRIRKDSGTRRGLSTLRAFLADSDSEVDVTGEWLTFREAWGDVRAAVLRRAAP
jgi:hypothetical protein